MIIMPLRIINSRYIINSSVKSPWFIIRRISILVTQLRFYVYHDMYNTEYLQMIQQYVFHLKV